jgi:RNA polymerase sigma-70 factor (ECF subfamily)
VRGASTEPSATGADDQPDVDAALLRRFVDESDDAAYTELVRRHRDRVYAICLRYFRDPNEAEDAAQEVFVALYRRAGSFVGTARFTTWLYRVAVNTCTDIARKRVRRPQASGYDPDWMADPRLDGIGRFEIDLDLSRAVQALAPEFRLVVVMRHVDGLSYEEIATATGLAMGTVKSRIHRAHAQLALALTVADGGEPSAPAVRPRAARNTAGTPPAAPATPDP